MNGYIERTGMNGYEKMPERYETEQKKHDLWGFMGIHVIYWQ